jgi:molecular chaperone GrpE
MFFRGARKARFVANTMTDQDIPIVSEQGASPEYTPPEEPTPESAAEAIAMLKDQLLRKAADYENLRRRTERERSELIMMANERLLVHILPFVDDLERSLASAADRADDPFVQGITLIHKNLMVALARAGVTPIAAAGEQFDVEIHEALLQVQRPDLAPHTVIEEVQKGYRLYDKVIRHAKVTVAGESEA